MLPWQANRRNYVVRKNKWIFLFLRRTRICNRRTKLILRIIDNIIVRGLKLGNICFCRQIIIKISVGCSSGQIQSSAPRQRAEISANPTIENWTIHKQQCHFSQFSAKYPKLARQYSLPNEQFYLPRAKSTR